MDYKSSHLIKGIFWSSIDKFGIVLLQLVLELFLARLLMPKDYGVVGIVLVFISLAVTFSEGGFSNALIQKQDRTEEDFTAVFYFNIFTAVCIYILIFLGAPIVEKFYDIEGLSLLLRVSSVSIIFSSAVIVHRTKMNLSMDFKKQAKFSLLSVAISGFISLGLAYIGMGVWALVIQILLLNFLNCIFIWFGFTWYPKGYFYLDHLKGLFGFGSKVLLSSLIQNIYFNAYPVVIGKILSTKQLGIYSKSNQFTVMPASVLTSVLQRVLFPFFSSHQHDDEKLFKANQFYTMICCLICFPLFFTMAAVSPPLIVILFSDKWSEMVVIFALFCISYSLYPITVNNMMMFQVKNKTKLFLNLEIATKIIGAVILFLTIRKGIAYIGTGILVQQILQLIITSVIMQKMLGREVSAQLRLVAPLFLSSLTIAAFIWYLLAVVPFNLYIKLLLGISVCVILFVCLYLLFYRKDINEIVLRLRSKN